MLPLYYLNLFVFVHLTSFYYPKYLLLKNENNIILSLTNRHHIRLTQYLYIKYNVYVSHVIPKTAHNLIYN